MFFPSPSGWEMEKDAPNQVPMNVIILAQTSHKILEDGFVPIFPVVISTPYSLQFKWDCTGIPLSAFCMEVIQSLYDCKYKSSVQHSNNTKPQCIQIPDKR